MNLIVCFCVIIDLFFCPLICPIDQCFQIYHAYTIHNFFHLEIRIFIFNFPRKQNVSIKLWFDFILFFICIKMFLTQF